MVVSESVNRESAITEAQSLRPECCTHGLQGSVRSLFV